MHRRTKIRTAKISQHNVRTHPEYVNSA